MHGALHLGQPSPPEVPSLTGAGMAGSDVLVDESRALLE